MFRSRHGTRVRIKRVHWTQFDSTLPDASDMSSEGMNDSNKSGESADASREDQDDRDAGDDDASCGSAIGEKTEYGRKRQRQNSTLQPIDCSTEEII
jgi:hypothetical protein